MKNVTKIAGIIATVAILALAVSCSKNEGSGGSAAGAIASIVGGGEATPHTDFSYRLITANDRVYAHHNNSMNVIGDATFSQIPDGVIIYDYSGNGGKVVIPATIEDLPVVMIGYNAFRGETDTEYRPAYEITEVVIPEGVEIIDYFAFMNCPNLTTVTLPASLKWIGRDAFVGCGELTTLNLPDSPSFILEDMYGRASAIFTMGKLPLKTRALLDELATKSVELNGEE